MHQSSDKALIVTFSEIALKKGNRRFFERELKTNIVRSLKDFHIQSVKTDFGRFVIDVSNDIVLDSIIERLKRVIGIANISISYRGSNDLDELSEQIYHRVNNIDFESFRIETRRTDKQYPFNSMQVSAHVGRRVHEGLHKRVDLNNPELTIYIQIFNKKVYYHYETISGIRGLPVGSVGKVVSLLSSGIDSPVSSFRMMTRGCRVSFIHCHSFPFTDKSSYHNATRLAEHLVKYENTASLYLVPVADIQQAVMEIIPSKLRLIIFRRMMLRLAETVARKEKAKAVITGESLGQVASQTLENMTAISEAIQLPILRPLIGMDKEEIIELAKAIGTFPISIEPYEDSCTYMTARHPETRAKLDEVLSAEDKIENWQDLLYETIHQTEIKKLRFPR